jgi:hemerythrin-like domain-containing protein
LTNLDYKINFNEPILEMIRRLKNEHQQFEIQLNTVQEHIGRNEIKEAIEIIHTISELIIRHAVEEEARIMRVIMQKAKEDSTESIKIMQEHNWVVNFLKHVLGKIENDVNQRYQSQQQQEDVKNKINEFVTNLRNHFSEEEQIVFPLALKADSG